MYILKNIFYLSVLAVKAKHILLLTVDNGNAQALGKPSSSSTDTTEPLFIGGVPG